MANKTVYRCKQGMVCSIKGQRTHFSSGDLVLEDHPVKPKDNPNFEEISEYVERISTPRHRGVVIEQTTAAPGEKRRLGRPKGAQDKGSETKPTTTAPADSPKPTAKTEQGADHGKA